LGAYWTWMTPRPQIRGAFSNPTPYRPYVQHLTASEPTGESSDLSAQLIVEAHVEVELLHVVEA